MTMWPMAVKIKGVWIVFVVELDMIEFKVETILKQLAYCDDITTKYGHVADGCQ